MKLPGWDKGTILEDVIDHIGGKIFEGEQPYDRVWLENALPDFYNHIQKYLAAEDNLPRFFSSLNTAVKSDMIIQYYAKKKRLLTSLIKQLKENLD